MKYGLPSARAAAIASSVRAERLVDPPDACRPSRSRDRPQPRAFPGSAATTLGGDLDVAVEVAVVDVGERLDEPRQAGLARLVARVGLEPRRRLRGDDRLGSGRPVKQPHAAPV